jgi:F0F1-type ATP synthase assembly protein I
MATVPETHEPEGGTRIWATFADVPAAARAARALADAGVEDDRIVVAEDPGSSEGPMAREREHREGVRIGTRLGAGAVVGASVGALLGVLTGLLTGTGSTGLALFTIAGALFVGGVGAFVSGLSGLRSATLDHRPTRGDVPGGAAVEVRADGELATRAIEVLRLRGASSLVASDAFGRPFRDLGLGPRIGQGRPGS